MSCVYAGPVKNAKIGVKIDTKPRIKCNCSTVEYCPSAESRFRRLLTVGSSCIRANDSKVKILKRNNENKIIIIPVRVSVFYVTSINACTTNLCPGDLVTSEVINRHNDTVS